MKIRLLFLLVFLASIIGCVEPVNTKSAIENPHQAAFDALLNVANENQYEARNDIQKKEFRESFEKDLSHFLDSIEILINWKGTISNIKTVEFGSNVTKFSFEISYKPEEHREISFHYEQFFENDSLSRDYIYNTVKEISDYSTVFFDGFIKRDEKNRVIYDYGDLAYAYPNYKFYPLEISTIKRADTISQNLKRALEVDLKLVQLLRSRISNHLSSEELDKKVNLLNFEESHSNLSQEEKTYSLRYRGCLMNYLRESL